MKILKIVINENNEENTFFYKGILELDFVSNKKDDNIIGFIGVNGSGKTVTLNSISFVYELLLGKNIKEIKSNRILKNSDNNITFNIYFNIENMVYKLETIISSDFYILTECFWGKEKSQIKSKNFEFTNSNILDSNIYNHCNCTNSNVLNKHFNEIQLNIIDDFNINSVINYSSEFLKLVDSNIEDFKILEKGYMLKFFNSREININNEKEIKNYLSTGTVRAVSLFSGIKKIIDSGGYLIIDQFEKDLNKEIILMLLRFFMDTNINKNNAILILSTLDLELVEELEKNKNIFMVENNLGIKVSKLS